MKRIVLGGIGVIAAASAAAQIYSEDFEVDVSASWRVNVSTAGNVANFFFDYSTVGIPLAPNSTGGSRGLKLESNIPGTGVFSGISVTPMGETYTGDYKLSFDAWQNFNGPFPAGGSGSTQITQAGIGAPEMEVQFPGTTYSGMGFAATGDGGSAVDYRAYNAPGGLFAPDSGVYAAGMHAGANNSSDPYYAGFGGLSAPAAQVVLFPQQTGTTAVGSLGMAWRRWDIEKAGNAVTWTVDGLLIATVQNPTFGGENIFFGQFDVNASSSTDPNARALIFGLIDNIEVTVVPEPSTFVALSLGLLALAASRKRRRAGRV